MERLSYTEQGSTETLRQGLEEFYRANPHFTQREGDSETDIFMRNHDRLHVVFGLTTRFDDEMLADFSAMFCSDVGIRNYLSYLKPLLADGDVLQGIKDDPKLKQSGWLEIGGQIVKALPKVLSLYRMGRKMPKKWPWTQNEAYQDRMLKDIRAEFAIKLQSARQM